MTMYATSRHDRADLLLRPPLLGGTRDDRWTELLVDRADQINALADLLARRLLSPEEFAAQKARVLDR
jgi:hypothetical protein